MSTCSVMVGMICVSSSSCFIGWLIGSKQITTRCCVARGTGFRAGFKWNIEHV